MATCLVTSSAQFFQLCLLLCFVWVVQAATPLTSNTSILRNIPLLSALSESSKRWSGTWIIMVGICLACGFGSYNWRRRKPDSKETKTAWATDNIDHHSLLKKHSTTKSYSTSSFKYNGIRTVHHPHPQADKLPQNHGPLPLLVFIHGLGGSIAQFASLLSTLVNIGPCLAIDLPGCGLSELSPKAWEAYTHEALVELLEVVIQEVCDGTKTKKVILIGHSMGCSFAVSLALSERRKAPQSFDIGGIVAICPKVSPIPIDQSKTFTKLLNIPSPMFNLWRSWDQRGGIKSASVTRFVGEKAPDSTKNLQLRFNRQSRTETFRRMAMGSLNLGPDHKGLPTPEDWGRLSVPIFAVAGESDVVTPPKELAFIEKAMGRDSDSNDQSSHKRAPQSFSSDSTVVTEKDSDEVRKQSAAVLKTQILPAPASHGLIYDFTTFRTLSGLIQDFIASHVDHRLALGWQLQTLKESNKWDVKNLTKWQGVAPVSDPIAGVFRALKTLREVDEIHSPKEFTHKWSSKIKVVVDISHESPVYNPRGLEDGGVRYIKFPTVSKIPPTVEEVREFISLIDQLRNEDNVSEPVKGDERLIGVHCHYGYNRTGFFICTYLIERLGYSVQDAIDEFQKRRPPGIRHEHFLDTLFVRYCIGLKRAPTL